MDLEKLIKQMTLKEKLYQLQQVNSDIYVSGDESLLKRKKTYIKHC